MTCRWLEDPNPVILGGYRVYSRRWCKISSIQYAPDVGSVPSTKQRMYGHMSKVFLLNPKQRMASVRTLNVETFQIRGGTTSAASRAQHQWRKESISGVSCFFLGSVGT